MPQRDSIDKVVSAYFAVVTREQFTYKRTVYRPKPLTVSPLLLRGFTCPEGCGGCCPRFSLDYLPTEERPYKLKQRLVEFNGREVAMMSDLQEDHSEHHCRNLRFEDGRCGIHGKQPFSCDFELIRSLIYSERDHPNVLTQKLFGRGHAMLRVDDKRGALCTMTPRTDETIADVSRKLTRLQQWTTHFGLKSTWIPEILALIQRKPVFSTPITLADAQSEQRAPGERIPLF